MEGSYFLFFCGMACAGTKRAKCPMLIACHTGDAFFVPYGQPIFRAATGSVLSRIHAKPGWNRLSRLYAKGVPAFMKKRSQAKSFCAPGGAEFSLHSARIGR